MLQDVSDTSNIKVNPLYEAEIEESYWKSVHGLNKKVREYQTPNPKPQTPNPKLQTPNPKPQLLTLVDRPAATSAL